MIFTFRLWFAGLAALVLSIAMHAAAGSLVTGLVAHPDSNQPVEFIEVTLYKADGSVEQSTATDHGGHFIFEQLPAGEYHLAYNRIGELARTTPSFTVDAAHPKVDLGRLDPPETVLQLEKFEVKSRQEKFLNSIDRKTYRVGQEIQSASGSASDLLQNVPSVDVDIDGNVSLRGSENVLILINGRTSTLMGRSRAEVLAQLPADEIEKIEVITNPSAKYKPDGTSGIINIALKRKHPGGLSGTASASVGNRDRYNIGASLTYNPGALSLFGSVSLRQDDRPRFATDRRTITDAVTGTVIRAEKQTVEVSRPFTRIARVGLDYAPDADHQFGLAGNYNRRTFHRYATDTNLVTTGDVVTSDYDRARFDPEFEQNVEIAGTYRHTWAGKQELKFELRGAKSDEVEDNHYVNTDRRSGLPPAADNIRFGNGTRSSEAIVGYTWPLDDGAKLEAGYTRTGDHYDADIRAEALDPLTGWWVPTPATSSHFIHRRITDAFYTTYARTLGEFGFLAGLRPELTRGTSRLAGTAADVPNDYARVYPSLHLAWRPAGRHEFQLNYSHRVRRPDIDELNPFPQYTDPFNLRAGNPRLRPEDTHSIEGGYAYTQETTNLTATVYERRTYHGFTSVTSDQGGGVLLTTRENLATSDALGLELTAGADLGSRVSVNFSANTFYNTIDASNLGFATNRSDVSWLAKLGVTLHLPRRTQLQFNTNYTSARLTPQGERRPAWVANLGLRHDLASKKTALILTVSDLFNSLKETSVLDTPLLHEESTRRRSARIVYAGLIYTFGQPAKKSKDDPLKFDNSL